MTVGTQPGNGPQLIDGTWVNGLAGGQNQTYQSGLTANNAASQSTATSIPAGIAIVEVDTSVANGSLVLPFANAGTEFALNNNTANSLDVYAQPGTNAATSSLDTINSLSNTTAFSAGANAITVFMCAKNGKWFTK